MRTKKLWCAVLVAMLTATAAVAQTRLDGTIEGKVVDSQGLPVPGATVTVTSPALIQTAVAATGADGRYRATRLPPGLYTVRVTMDAFKTRELTGIDLSVGRVVVIDVTIEPGGATESVVVEAETPVIDTQQVKNVQTITKEVIDQLPLSRDAILGPTQLAPGVVERTSSGSSRNETNYLVDGANVQAPDQGYSEATISWDAIEEIEFITTTNPMENYGSIGGTLNVVTRTGGNNFHGMGQYYFTNKDFSQVLLPKENSDAIGIGQPSLPEFSRDYSARVAGPVMKDRIWFVANYRKYQDEQLGSFVPVTINGRQYDNYNAPYDQKWIFGKLTAQISPKVRWFGSYNYASGDRPNEFSVPARRTLEATRHWQAKQHTASSQLTWAVSNRTLFDARLGLWRFNYDGLSQPGTEGNPAFFDEFSGYQYGRWSAGRDGTDKRNYNGSLSVTHYVDGWQGSHELKGGLDYQDLNGGFYFSSENSISEWRTYQDNLYYYRGLLGIDSPDPVRGDGRLTLLTASTTELGSGVPSLFSRMGGFVSDIWRVNSRFTLNLGLRYDRSAAEIGDVAKPPADALAQAIGEAVFVPRWGINPFGELASQGQGDRIPGKGFSAQAAAAYDLTGDGKTILKGSFGRYQERLLGWHFNFGVPSGGASFLINWWDLNGNQQPDLPGVDRYAQANTASPVNLIGTTWHQNIDPDLKTPHMNEYRLGVERQLGDFNVGVAGIFRDRKNQLSDPLYDLATGTYWSGVESGYWVPFETTIPAAGASFPAVPVTVFFQRNNAPAAFNRLTNVPEAVARYQALDLTLNKRWNGRYLLGGSVVFSKNFGNYEIAGGTGRGQFQTPNFLINREDARQPFDRPVVVKLWGSVSMPAGVRASYNFIYAQGAPWNRTVTVQPPAAWAAANGVSTASQGIWVEPRGNRRNQSTNNLDLRLEKLFKLAGHHEVGVFVDGYNITGSSYLNFQSNPGGTWSPADVGTTRGTFSPASTGARSQVGVRTFRFSVRYSFN
ncbi:MAG TPA: TonB-dependent receptor [Vicinamibacteria bacterium]|nr:TonB-dependent receptor [Vicinamibacteria bacterium]